MTEKVDDIFELSKSGLYVPKADATAAELGIVAIGGAVAHEAPPEKSEEPLPDLTPEPALNHRARRRMKQAIARELRRVKRKAERIQRRPEAAADQLAKLKKAVDARRPKTDT